jgi:hypothetical protein
MPKPEEQDKLVDGDTPPDFERADDEALCFLADDSEHGNLARAYYALREEERNG